MRLLLAAILFAIYGSAIAGINNPSGSTSNAGLPFNNAFVPLKMGGGGLVTGMTISAQGVRFARTDAASGYLWSPTDLAWHDIVTIPTMPSGRLGWSATTGTSRKLLAAAGVTGAVGSDSNASVAYLYYSGFVYVATNVDTTNPTAIRWNDTGFAPQAVTFTNGQSIIAAPSNQLIANQQVVFTGGSLPSPLVAGQIYYVYNGGNTSSSQFEISAIQTVGPAITITSAGTGAVVAPIAQEDNNPDTKFSLKIWVDPNNADHVFVGPSCLGYSNGYSNLCSGSSKPGLWETTNGTHSGGATWTKISSAVIPDPAAITQYQVAFDPKSGTNGSGLTNTFYVFTAGQKTYQTTNGNSASLAQTPSGGPTIGAQWMTVAPDGSAGTPGTLWVMDYANFNVANGNLWKFSGNTWSAVSGVGGHIVIVNPTNANHVVAIDNGGCVMASSNASTFSGQLCWTKQIGTMLVPGDAPWHELFSQDIGFLSAGGAAFDPLVNDQIIATGGQGLYKTQFGLLPLGSPISTNRATASGNATLHFASTPAWVAAGMAIADNTATGVIPTGATVLSTTGTTVVMSANAAGVGVGNGDSLSFMSPYTSMVNGIEEAINNTQALYVGAPNTLLASYQDVGLAVYTAPFNTTNNLQNTLPIMKSSSFGLMVGDGPADGPPGDPGFTVAKLRAESVVDFSGYSSDQFKTDYVPFNTWNAGQIPVDSGHVAAGAGGVVRLTVPSTTGLTTWTTTGSGSTGSIVCTNLLGSLYAVASPEIRLGCFETTVIDSTHIDLAHTTFDSSLYTLGYNLLVWAPSTTSYQSYLGAYNINSVTSYGGTIGITMNSSPNNLQHVCISGVVGVPSNGCWIVYDRATFNGSITSNVLTVSTAPVGAPVAVGAQVLDAGGNVLTTITSLGTGTGGTGTYNVSAVANQVLQGFITIIPNTVSLRGSTFSGSFNAASSSGLAAIWSCCGGNLAVSSRSNIFRVGDSQTSCSTDGGATWTNTQTFPGQPQTQSTINGTITAGGTTLVLNSGGSLTGYPGGTIITTLDDGRYIRPVITLVSGLTYSMPASSIPTGHSILNGTPIVFVGWPSNPHTFNKIATADKVTANTFYVVNDGQSSATGGVYKFTNCGNAIRVNSGAANWGGSGGGSKLDTVPGEAGHIFYTDGPPGDPNAQSNPSSARLLRSCNGTNSTTDSVTFAAVPGFYEAFSFGFGSPYPGHNYPAIYVIGFYDAGDVQANAVFGVWRSVDDPNHGVSGSCTAGTWTKISDGFPNGARFELTGITGDMGTYGAVYMGSQAGLWAGRFN